MKSEEFQASIHQEDSRNGSYQPIRCKECNQSFISCNLSRPHYCPICFSNTFESLPVTSLPAKAELVIPPRIKTDQILKLYHQFLNKSWFKPDDLTPANLLSRTSFMYVPMWLLDSKVDGSWTAEMGFEYQVKGNVEIFKNESWQSNEVTQTKTRWEPRIGSATRFYHNIALPSSTHHPDISRIIRDYDPEQAIEFSKKKINGLILSPDIHPDEVIEQAKSKIKKTLMSECVQAGSAEHIRNFSLDAEIKPQDWTLLLLPLILSFYHEDKGEKNPIYINGQNGIINGARLASQRKGSIWTGILFGLGLLLCLLGSFLLLLGAAVPFMPVLGTLFLVPGLVTICLSIIPFIYVLYHNRQEHSKNLRL